MAPLSTSSHNFQKLKLDTSAPHKPVASSFASIPRSDSQQNASQHPSRLATELAGADHPYFDDDFAQPHHHHHHDPNADFVSYGSDAVAVSSSGSEGEEHVESRFRNRTKSISFDPEVTLDNGGRFSLEEPLPRPAPRPSQEEDKSKGYTEDRWRSERRRLQQHVGESRYPLLQSTVDELVNDAEYQDQVASLTSDTTASPVADEARTPLETPAEYLLSPVAASSPIECSSYFGRRATPQRARSYRSEIDGEGGSLRRISRRSSARSARSMSSMSPAASFLSQYKASEAPLKPTEPDDEGQGIGYNGEYIIGKQIGYGGFSVVKEVTTIEDGARITNAVKIVRKQLKDKSEIENEEIQTQFDHEVEIWRFLRHPYILPLFRVYSTDFATFCITRLNKGGTLFDLVRNTRKKKKCGVAKHLARRYAYQVASAMRYLHNDVQVVHRDIKLENCLLDMSVANADTEGGDVLLCDFGMADFVVSDQRDGPEPQPLGDNQNIGPANTSTSVAGSLQYAAPELFNAHGPVFSPAADIWAFGVVLYALLTATLPFNEGIDIKTTTKIRRGEWDVEPLRTAEAVQDGGLEDVVDVVKGCLEMDTEKRWTVHDILECAWLQDCDRQFENVSRAWLADS